MTWNLFQGPVYGFPVSGITSPVTALAVEQSGPPAWTGGIFGPEAGGLGLVAELVGCALIVWRERRRQGSLTVCTALVNGSLAPKAVEVAAVPEPAAVAVQE